MSDNNYIGLPFKPVGIAGRVQHIQSEQRKVAFDVQQREVFKIAFGYVGLPYDSVVKNGFNQESFSAIEMPLKLDDYTFPIEPTIDLVASKTIVRTEIDGGKGTFKELFRQNDYKITIKGVIIGANEDSYPSTEVCDLEYLINKMGSVEVKENELLRTIFGITHITIVDCKLPSMPGYPNVQPYVIEAESDFYVDTTLELTSLGDA